MKSHLKHAQKCNIWLYLYGKLTWVSLHNKTTTSSIQKIPLKELVLFGCRDEVHRRWCWRRIFREETIQARPISSSVRWSSPSCRTKGDGVRTVIYRWKSSRKTHLLQCAAQFSFLWKDESKAKRKLREKNGKVVSDDDVNTVIIQREGMMLGEWQES